MYSPSAMPCKPRTKRGETHDRYSTVALATTYHTPQTETLKEIQIMTATLTFPDRQSAEDFAKAYSRHTLRGHSISPDTDNGVSVVVDGLSETDRRWIDNHVQAINAR